MPAAIATWMLALEAAEAQGGKMPLDVLLGAAIKHAQGYTVTRSQARLTAEKLAECKDAPGFAATFLVDGKPPAEGATLQAGRARRDARAARAMRDWRTSIAAMSGARSRPISSASARR